MKAQFCLLLLPLFVTTALSGPVSTDNTSTTTYKPGGFHRRRCDCYIVSGSEPRYFQNYQFWDFRKVPLPRNTTTNNTLRTQADGTVEEDEDEDEGDEEDEPRGEAGTLDNGFNLATVLFSKTPFAKDWTPQTWGRKGSRTGPVPLINLDENVFFARNPQRPDDSTSTQLVLRTTRFPDHTSTAEIENRLRNVFHCSLRVRMRIMTIDSVTNQPTRHGHRASDPAPANVSVIPGGACAGIFTYRSATCETDLEILTSDPPNRIRYANQPDYDPVTDREIPEATTIAHLPLPWTSFITHRLDWLPNITQWYADSQLQGFKTYHVPDQPSVMAINLWSNGGVWTGDMPVGQSVYMGIEWIEVAYNTSTNIHSAPNDIVPLQRHMVSSMVDFMPMEDDVDDESSQEEANVGGIKKNKEGCHRPCWLDDLRHH